MYADVVATIALIGALGSIGWQVFKEVRWDKPSLAVSGRLIYAAREINGGEYAEFWDLEVVVANVGNVATQIVDLYWEFESKDDSRFLVRGSEMADGEISFEYNGEVQVHDGTLEPSVPRQLARNESANWMFERPRKQNAAIGKATKGRPVVVYVSRTKRVDTLGRNPHRAEALGDWRPVAVFPKMLGSGRL